MNFTKTFGLPTTKKYFFPLKHLKIFLGFFIFPIFYYRNMIEVYRLFDLVSNVLDVDKNPSHIVFGTNAYNFLIEPIL